MTTNLQAQTNAKAMQEFSKENKHWMQMALEAVNAWGRGEGILQHLIAEKLKEAHQMGQDGETPVYVDPEARSIVRRTRPVPTPEPAPTRIRRTRA